MRGIKRSPYRQPVTPEGLRSIEEGSLDYFDQEVFGNFNTGVLEQYLEERNRTESFKRSKFNWKKVLLSIFLIGVPFILITQYVTLQTGIMLGGAFYIAYIAGLFFKWSPTEINIGSGAATATEKTITGFIYTFPAIYILGAKGVDGFQSFENGFSFVHFDLMVVMIICSILASFLGLMYFIIFRRIWIVEDPLPSPGFQAFIKLLDISNSMQSDMRPELKGTMKRLLVAFAGMFALATFLRLPLVKVNSPLSGQKDHYYISIADRIFHAMGLEDWIGSGTLSIPARFAKYTHPSFAISGMLFAIGWFLRTRAALILFLGSIFSWFVIVPLAVKMNLPVGPFQLVEGESSFIRVRDIDPDWFGVLGLSGVYSTAMVASLYFVTPIVIGVVLGAGSLALIKLIPGMKPRGDALFGGLKKADVRKFGSGGRYEWSTNFILPTMCVNWFTFTLLFWLVGGFGFIPSILLGTIMVPIIFLLSALTAKITGEVGLVPTSTMTLILIFILYFTLKAMIKTFGNPMPDGEIMLMVLIASTIFACTISMASDIMWDFKTGLYIGTRPYHLIKGETMAIVIGVPIAGLVAIWISGQVIENGWAAPQAKLMAGLAEGILGGSMMWRLVGLGLLIGVLVESLTGMGTAFAIGMYVPFYIPFGIFIGAVSRDLWEKRWLKRKATALGWNEREITLRTLDSYVVMIGLLVGEALFGTALAIGMMITG